MEYLTQYAAIRSNGSATATEASNANKYAFDPIILDLSDNANCNISNRQLLDYIANLVDERTAEPKDDLISKLVVEQVLHMVVVRILDLLADHMSFTQLNSGHIEKSDAVQIAFLLLVAGNATMVNMINLVQYLFRTETCINS